jgi:hypothetical protein
MSGQILKLIPRIGFEPVAATAARRLGDVELPDPDPDAADRAALQQTQAGAGVPSDEPMRPPIGAAGM